MALKKSLIRIVLSTLLSLNSSCTTTSSIRIDNPIDRETTELNKDVKVRLQECPPVMVDHSSSRPEYLSFDELVSYISDKKVVLFGMDHETKPCNGEDTDRFINYLPELKRIGFTHVAIELYYKWQGLVDKYASQPNEKNKEKLASQLGIYNDGYDLVGVIETAINNDLGVIFIDNHDPEKTIERDKYMEIAIKKVINKGGRIAALLGTSHINVKEKMPYGLKEYRAGKLVKIDDVKPVAWRLVERYSKELIGTVNLVDCYGDHIDACVGR